MLLALGAAIASTYSAGHASKITLGGQAFVPNWSGSERTAPEDEASSSLRTPALARTSVAEPAAPPSPETMMALRITRTDPPENGVTLFSTTAAPAAPVATEPASAAASAPAAAALAPDKAVALAVISAPKKREVVTYEVAPGDTLSGIASKFGISTESVLWSNEVSNANRLALGDKLRIVPVDGMVHTVKAGDTLSGIASRYKVSVEDITGFAENGLPGPDSLHIGQDLVIPGATKPAPPPPPAMVAAAAAPAPSAPAPAPAPKAAPAAPAPAPAPPPKAAPPSSSVMWPVRGPIFTYFSGYHPGLDISPPYGTPVVAIRGGVVTAVRLWEYSYGHHILIDHGNGISAMYAHLSSQAVSVGETVSAGEVIGRVGNTGRSTGPHLHFELYRNGAAINPLGMLP